MRVSHALPTTPCFRSFARSRKATTSRQVPARLRSPLLASSLVGLVFAIGCAVPDSTPGDKHANEHLTPTELANGSSGGDLSAQQPSSAPADSTPGGDPSDASVATPSTGDPTLDDEDLRAFKRNGFDSLIFADTCVSKKDGEATIEQEPLPVGAGRWLECTTSRNPSSWYMKVESITNDPWCVYGTMTSSHTWADAALKVSVTSSPDDSAWTLMATHEGPEISISRVEAAGLGLAWPLGLDVKYTTTEMKHNPENALCDSLSGS